MGFPGKLKFPIISNHFAICGHKGELSAVFSAIYYLKNEFVIAASNDFMDMFPNLVKAIFS